VCLAKSTDKIPAGGSGFSGYPAGHIRGIPEPHRLHGGVRHVPHPLQAFRQGQHQAQNQQITGGNSSRKTVQKICFQQK